MKTVFKKLFSLMLVAVLLVSVLPFQASAAETTTMHFYKYDFATNNFVLHKTVVSDTTSALYSAFAPELSVEAGWKLDGWVEYSAGMTFEQVNAAPRLASSKLVTDTVYIAAAYALDTTSVEYVVNVNGVGANVAKPANVSFVNGKSFGYSAAFANPASMPEGYSFGGWKFGETILTSANWSSVVFNPTVSTKLYAHWVPSQVKVTYYAWSDSASGYVAVASEHVDYGTYVKSIPSKGMVDTKSSYEFIGWQTTAGADAVAVDPSTTKITGNTSFYARYLGVEVPLTLDPKDAKLDPITKIVRIGEKVGAYGGKLPTPSLTGYTFQGWYTTDGTKVTDDSIFWNSYSKLEAKWAKQSSVRLLVYSIDPTTKKISDEPIVSRLIPGGVEGGLLDTDDIALSTYLPAGKTYKLTGYFDAEGWTDYKMNQITKTVDNVRCAASGETAVYAVVEEVVTTNNTPSGSGNTGSGNTNTNKPADPTNPATGDTNMIVTSMTVMTLSAAALVVFMLLRKRKMI